MLQLILEYDFNLTRVSSPRNDPKDKTADYFSKKKIKLLQNEDEWIKSPTNKYMKELCPGGTLHLNSFPLFKII